MIQPDLETFPIWSAKKLLNIKHIREPFIMHESYMFLDVKCETTRRVPTTPTFAAFQRFRRLRCWNVWTWRNWSTVLWMPLWACGFLDAKRRGTVSDNAASVGKVFLVDGCWWCNELGVVFSYSLWMWYDRTLVNPTNHSGFCGGILILMQWSDCPGMSRIAYVYLFRWW